MPTKRCGICQKMKPITDEGICCPECEEMELDMLMAVYAYIHCSKNDFCAPQDIIDGMDPMHGVKVNLSFLRGWISKEWLEKNYFEALGVPQPVQDAIEEFGFIPTAGFKKILQRQKEHKPPVEDETLQQIRNMVEEGKNRTGGKVFIERKHGET